jgi:LacI family transcriptional regulator
MAEHASSIVEVAKRAGVSIATASRVLSQTAYPVADATRRKVLRAAKELDYTPNPMARGLRSRRSHLIAVLVGDNTDPYFAEIMRGVEDVASEFGYLTIMCNSERKPERELHYLRILRDYRTDGILFAGGGLNEPGYPERLETLVREILARGAAVVTLAQHTLTVPSIQPDNFGGARRMTDYLLRLGHRRIAFVSGPANVTAAEARLQGYRAALEHAGRPVELDLVLPGNFDQTSGERAAEHVARMEGGTRPTAIFAANDETAIGVLSGLARLGVAVPGDISVCGFGDLPVAQIVAPSLTTVRIELRALGRAGARALLAQLSHEEVAPVQVLPTTIVERASTAPLTSVTRLRDG